MHREEPGAWAAGGPCGDDALRPELQARFDAAYGTRVDPWTAEHHRQLIHRTAARPALVRSVAAGARQLGRSARVRRLGQAGAVAAAAVTVVVLSHGAPWLWPGSDAGPRVPPAIADMYASRALSEAYLRLSQADVAAQTRPERVPQLLEETLGALERAERLTGSGSEHLTQATRREARARAIAIADALEGDARQRARTVAQRLAIEPDGGEEPTRSPRRRTPGASIEVAVDPEPAAAEGDGGATLASADDDDPDEANDGGSRSPGAAASAAAGGRHEPPPDGAACAPDDAAGTPAEGGDDAVADPVEAGDAEADGSSGAAGCGPSAAERDDAGADGGDEGTDEAAASDDAGADGAVEAGDGHRGGDDAQAAADGHAGGGADDAEAAADGHAGGGADAADADGEDHGKAGGEADDGQAEGEGEDHPSP